MIKINFLCFLLFLSSSVIAASTEIIKISEEDKQKERCETAKEDLKIHRRRMRDGYSAREANDMNEEERELFALRQSYCRK